MKTFTRMRFIVTFVGNKKDSGLIRTVTLTVNAGSQVQALRLACEEAEKRLDPESIRFLSISKSNKR